MKKVIEWFLHFVMLSWDKKCECLCKVTTKKNYEQEYWIETCVFCGTSEPKGRWYCIPRHPIGIY